MFCGTSVLMGLNVLHLCNCFSCVVYAYILTSIPLSVACSPCSSVTVFQPFVVLVCFPFNPVSVLTRINSLPFFELLLPVILWFQPWSPDFQFGLPCLDTSGYWNKQLELLTSCQLNLSSVNWHGLYCTYPPHALPIVYNRLYGFMTLHCPSLQINQSEETWCVK